MGREQWTRKHIRSSFIGSDDTCVRVCMCVCLHPSCACVICIRAARTLIAHNFRQTLTAIAFLKCSECCYFLLVLTVRLFSCSDSGDWWLKHTVLSLLPIRTERGKVRKKERTSDALHKWMGFCMCIVVVKSLATCSDKLKENKLKTKEFTCTQLCWTAAAVGSRQQQQQQHGDGDGEMGKA